MGPECSSPATNARRCQGTSKLESGRKRHRTSFSKIASLMADPIGWLADLLVGGRVSWCMMLAVGRSVGWLVGWLIIRGPSTEPPKTAFDNQLVAWLLAGLVGRVFGWLIDFAGSASLAPGRAGLLRLGPARRAGNCQANCRLFYVARKAILQALHLAGSSPATPQPTTDATDLKATKQPTTNRQCIINASRNRAMHSLSKQSLKQPSH